MKLCINSKETGSTKRFVLIIYLFNIPAKRLLSVVDATDDLTSRGARFPRATLWVLIV
jgi:hypothetical protein